MAFFRTHKSREQAFQQLLSADRAGGLNHTFSKGLVEEKKSVVLLE